MELYTSAEKYLVVLIHGKKKGYNQDVSLIVVGLICARWDGDEYDQTQSRPSVSKNGNSSRQLKPGFLSFMGIVGFQYDDDETRGFL